MSTKQNSQIKLRRVTFFYLLFVESYTKQIQNHGKILHTKIKLDPIWIQFRKKSNNEKRKILSIEFSRKKETTINLTSQMLLFAVELFYDKLMFLLIFNTFLNYSSFLSGSTFFGIYNFLLNWFRFKRNVPQSVFIGVFFNSL